MKTHILIAAILVSGLDAPAQNRIIVSGNPGMFFTNSENDMKTMGDQRMEWAPGFSVCIERDNVLGMDFHLEYNFIQSRADVMEFPRTNSMGQLIGRNEATLTLSIHSLDISVTGKANQWLSVGAGPTFAYASRTIEVPVQNWVEGDEFVDRLVSVCIGLNCSASMELPLNEGPDYLFFFSSAKLRYLHSVWFDGRGRNLDNYYQSFLSGQVNMGLGYNF